MKKCMLIYGISSRNPQQSKMFKNCQRGKDTQQLSRELKFIQCWFIYVVRVGF